MIFEDIFITRVILSFIIAGTWITVATILSEKLGTKIGGLIGNLPSNIVVSLFFIGLTQTPEFAATAAKVVPLTMVINSAFLFVFVLVAKKYQKKAFPIALATWFLLAIPVGLIGYNNILTGTIIYILLTIIMFYILEYKMHIPSIQKKKFHYTIKEILIRAIFAGTIVSTAVIISAILGPIWGGIFSTFPAVMLSSMYILTKAQGLDFARATGKVMLPASANITVYAIAISITYPIYGLIVGTIISYTIATITVIALYPFLKKVK
jgi:hypothetical protein